MLSDVEIAQAATPLPIRDVAAKLGIAERDLFPYGHDKAKLNPAILAQARSRPGKAKLVLVTAITPTRAGEGKTTTTIGLGQALSQLGESVCLALREPSLGPCMGVKGGATGGGYSQVIPMESINLHFTGDLHAVTAAHNLLAAAIDNKLHFNDPLGIDPRRVLWRRVIDMNDRSLRDCVVGLGGRTQGVPRQTGFDITAASEVMAMLCLANDMNDLRARIDRTVVAYSYNKEPITAGQIGVTGAMLSLLQDAMMPNLVQTLEGTPALVHGGPFANIAHGCNSVVATKMAMHLADWTITEAGFGCDLGGEKFLDIKCRSAELDPDVVVLVATVRALKLHGGVAYADLGEDNPDAVSKGIDNLAKHIESVQQFNKKPIVALNRFHSDSDAECARVASFCEERNVAFALADHFARGGEGALELAKVVLEQGKEEGTPLQHLYALEDSIEEKVTAVAVKMYGADGVEFSSKAKRSIRQINRLGFGSLPICVAKTQSSLSDDPKRLGRPTGFRLQVSDVLINAGSGFVVVLTGNILRMPGLPRKPSAEKIDVVEGKIRGLS